MQKTATFVKNMIFFFHISFMTWLSLVERELDNAALEAENLSFALFPIIDFKGCWTTAHMPNLACCLIL